MLVHQDMFSGVMDCNPVGIIMGGKKWSDFGFIANKDAGYAAVDSALDNLLRRVVASKGIDSHR
jgi:hypothetical protein